jgi:hypothetical protein
VNTTAEVWTVPKTTPETQVWCDKRAHPWSTYNPWMDRTWCRCGARQAPGEQPVDLDAVAEMFPRCRCDATAACHCSDNPPPEVDTAAQRAQMRRVVRHFEHYTSEQRSNMMASHRLGYQQKRAISEPFYTHPDVPGLAYSTRGEAARAGLVAVQRACRAEMCAAKFAADTILSEPPRPLEPTDANLAAVLAGCVIPPGWGLYDAIRAVFAARYTADETPDAELVVSGWARVS